jgi:hypothetical protein
VPAQASRDRPRSHSIQNAVVAVGLLAELIWLGGHVLFGWGDRVYAATPPPLIYQAPAPPSGRDVLLQLATAAARQPASRATARTPYAYVKWQEWRLAAQIGGASAPSRVLPAVTQSWRRPDGAGRILTITRKVNGSTVDDATIGAGHPLPALSASETVLARGLALGSPISGASARQFVEVTAVAESQPIPPTVEVAILRLLAGIPGLVNSGTVVDRDGRAGVAVSLDSGYAGATIRYTLIFDPRAGKLLEADQTLTGNPGKLDVADGAILAYTTLLASGYVANTTTRPPGAALP